MNTYNPFNMFNPYLPYRPLPLTGIQQLTTPSQSNGANANKSSDQGNSQEPSQQMGNGNTQQQSNHSKKQQKSQKSNAMISFDKLDVGTVSSSSGIFNGKNIQFGWSSHSKSNTGFGKVSGKNNKVNKNTNVVFDNDQLDTPIDDRDTMWSPIPTT